MIKRIGLFFVLFPAICAADSVVPIDAVEESVNIRLSPDAASEIVGKLEQGSSAERVSSIDGWHEIKLVGGATGFISADWTRVIVEEAIVEEAIVEEAVVEEAIEEAVVEAAAAEVVPAEEVVAPIVEEAAVPVVTEAVEETLPEEPAATSNLKGTKDFLVRFRNENEGESSQIFDNGNQVGIGTTEPKQRLEVNGSIQIHEQNSSVAGLMITQSSGDTGYIMHNRASTLTIGAGSVDRITVDRDGNVGFGVARPRHPLEMASGAHVTAGGVWTNSSSRDRKENIAELQPDAAMNTLMALQPVTFNYKNEVGENYVGFIAEDVPELVAVGDRSALSTMDIVAVLTRVVQEQEKKIEALEARLDAR